jgi:hypothetical protein
MKIICMELLQNKGKDIGVEQTHHIVQEYADKKSDAEEKIPLYEGGQPVSNKTVRQYHKELALHKYLGIRTLFHLCGLSLSIKICTNYVTSRISTECACFCNDAAMAFEPGQLPKWHCVAGLRS